MVSKNNRIRRMEEVAGRQSHFGIRKLTVGAASVLLGITLLFGANAKVARADGTDGASPGNGSTNEVVNPAEGPTPNVNNEQQGEKPAAPSKATDKEATAYKNLKSAIEYARSKGLTVSGPYDSKPGDNARIPDELVKSKVGVIYDNEDQSAKDMQTQADEIQKKISTYVEKRNEFIQGLKEQGIYKDGDVDPATLAQHLILQSEPQAESYYKIQDNNGNWTTTDKENKVVTVTTDPNAPFVNAPFVKPAYAVHLKNNNQVTGPIIQITYTNLKNSEYDGKPLGKIVETFSDVHATDINDSEAALYISTNPTNGWLYTHCDGVTVTIQLYDNQAQPIKIDSSAYVSVSSLNSNGLTATPDGETSDIKGRTEAAQLLSKGSAMSIPESSVQVFPDNKVFSPSDNEDLLYNKTHNKDQINYWGKFFAPREADWNKLSPDQQENEIQKVGNYVIKNYSDWDNTGSKKIFGSALYKVEKNPIVIRSYVIRNSSNSIPGYWFTYSTTVPQTSFDANNTIKYYFATAHATSQVSMPQVSTRHITYVNRQGNTKVAPPKDQKITFTGTATKDNSTGNIVKVDETGVIKQVGDGKVDNINNYGNWTWETNDGATKSGNGDSAEIDRVPSPTIKDMHVVNVSTDATKDGKNVDSTTLKRGNSYNVVVTYDDDTEVVNEKKDVTRKIHYTGAGEATPKDPDPEEVHFTATGIRDKRTGEFVKLDEDHHIVLDKDGKVVPGTLTWVGPNREKDTGSWAGKPSPVVNGYHIKGVDRDSKNGIDVDLVDNFNHKKVGYTVTVTYEPNGHIIPVDPNGNQIPGANQPRFETDPNDPRNTVPGTPPTIAGYHPRQTTINPDPTDPSKDVKVTYDPDESQGTVTRTIHFVYENGQPADPDQKQIVDVTKDASGNVTKPGTYQSYKPRVISGYVSDVSEVPSDTADKDKEVTVTYKKIGNIVPVDPKTNQAIPGAPTKPLDNDPTDPSKGIPTKVPDIQGKTPSKPTADPDPTDPTKDVNIPYTDNNTQGQVTRKIHYVYDTGTTAHDDTIQSVDVTKRPDGSVIDNGQTYDAVKPPVINGYVSNVSEVPSDKATSDKEYTVTYKKIGNPGNPGDQGDTPTPEPTPEPEPTPSPTPDDQPDSEISSDGHFENVKAKNKLDKTNPKKVDAYKKERKIIKTKIAKQGHTEIAELIEDKVTRENNVKVVSDTVENKAAEPKLPQTGEADNSIIGLLGMLLASFAAIFGFDSLHSHDKKHKN